ncbi:MAG: CBS domain-containing protein [Rubrivivax sp.]|nr:CBS domain-containing protein [Rubrivivax sp.]
MKTAAYVLKSKANQTTHTITPEASVFDAVKLMADKDIGAVVVMVGSKVAGLVTERDYARKITLMSRQSKDTPVREIMTSDVLYVCPERTTDECMALMTENRVRHLPVMDGDRLLGLISIGDLVKDIISEQQFIIQQLEHYIAGDRG